MGRDDILVYPVRTSKVGCLLHYVIAYLGYDIVQYDMHQWLLLQFLVLLMIDAESVRNMGSDLAVINKQYCQSCIMLVLYII